MYGHPIDDLSLFDSFDSHALPGVAANPRSSAVDFQFSSAHRRGLQLAAEIEGCPAEAEASLAEALVGVQARRPKMPEFVAFLILHIQKSSSLKNSIRWLLSHANFRIFGEHFRVWMSY